MTAAGETWYEIEWGKLRTLTVIKETEHTVTHTFWGNPTRMNKHNRLFKSKLEAETVFHALLLRNIEALKAQLRAAEKELAEFEARR